MSAFFAPYAAAHGGIPRGTAGSQASGVDAGAQVILSAVFMLKVT